MCDKHKKLDVNNFDSTTCENITTDLAHID